MKQPANPRLKQQLKKMSVDELVGLFRQYGLEQDEAMLGEERAKVNRLVWKLKDVGDELKSREGDQRSALLSLYNHRNAQVRLHAIRATLALAPDIARQALEALANSKEYPTSGDAGMTIRALDQGIFKPT
jgi:uncharacterized protein DUF2019